MLSAELDGRRVRAHTRRAAAARATTTLLGRLGDLWSHAVTIAIAVAVLGGGVSSLQERLAVPDEPLVPPGASGGTTATAAAVVAVAGLLLVLDRLGPLSSTPAAATWWLPLPADRRGLLLPELWRVGAAVIGVAVLAALPLALALPAQPTVGSVAAVLAAVAGAAGTVVAVTAVNQAWGRSGRLAPVAGAVAVGVGVVTAGAATVAVVLGHRLGVTAPPVAAGAPLLVVAVLFFVLAAAGLGRLRAGQLRALGVSSQQAAFSLLWLDTRDLGRALAGRSLRAPRRGRRYRPVRSAPGAVVAADLTALARGPRQLGQLLLAACLPVVVARSEGMGEIPLLVWTSFVAGWALAATAAGHPARTAQAAPAIDRLLPLSSTATSVARSVVPLAALLAVTTLSGSLLAVGPGGTALWAAMCAATAPAWAAAALRGAYRPDLDWAGPVVSTPMGVVPVGAGGGLVRGIDVGIAGSLPLAAACLAGGPSPAVVLVQLCWSVALAAPAVRFAVPPRRA